MVDSFFLRNQSSSLGSILNSKRRSLRDALDLNFLDIYPNINVALVVEESHKSLTLSISSRVKASYAFQIEGY